MHGYCCDIFMLHNILKKYVRDWNNSYVRRVEGKVLHYDTSQSSVWGTYLVSLKLFVLDQKK